MNHFVSLHLHKLQLKLSPAGRYPEHHEQRRKLKLGLRQLPQTSEALRVAGVKELWVKALSTSYSDEEDK